jgi:hypothetical protein
MYDEILQYIYFINQEADELMMSILEFKYIYIGEYLHYNMIHVYIYTYTYTIHVVRTYVLSPSRIASSINTHTHTHMLFLARRRIGKCVETVTLLRADV